MFWQLASFPTCRFHVFLSHSREDHLALVRPIYDVLSQIGIESFIDTEEYYYGRDSRSALKDAILESRHTVFFVTDAMLNSSRGWCVLELAFAELLETNLTHQGGQLATAFLPLFLVPQSDERLPKSVWQLIRDRGRFFESGAGVDPIEWCCRQIQDFLTRERQLSKTTATYARKSPEFATTLKQIPGRFERVAKFQPSWLPLT
jgi:TIR domain